MLKIPHAVVPGKGWIGLAAEGEGELAGGAGGPRASGAQGGDDRAESGKVSRPLRPGGGVERDRHRGAAAFSTRAGFVEEARDSVQPAVSEPVDYGFDAVG